MNQVIELQRFSQVIANPSWCRRSLMPTCRNISDVFHYGQIIYVLIIIGNIMPSKPPVIFPNEQRLLAAFGERIRLARLRRKLNTTTVSQRAGLSRSTLYNAERGDAGVTLGSYLRILATLGLEGDISTLAADDALGRKLQDLGLEAPPKRKRQATTP